MHGAGQRVEKQYKHHDAEAPDGRDDLVLRQGGNQRADRDTGHSDQQQPGEISRHERPVHARPFHHRKHMQQRKNQAHAVDDAGCQIFSQNDIARSDGRCTQKQQRILLPLLAQQAHGQHRR